MRISARWTYDGGHSSTNRYSTAYPALSEIYDDLPCTPVDNVIEDNVYCHGASRGGGKFIDRDADTVRGCLPKAAPRHFGRRALLHRA
jgi:hypothetical protein